MFAYKSTALLLFDPFAMKIVSNNISVKICLVLAMRSIKVLLCGLIFLHNQLS